MDKREFFNEDGAACATPLESGDSGCSAASRGKAPCMGVKGLAGRLDKALKRVKGAERSVSQDGRHVVALRLGNIRTPLGFLSAAVSLLMAGRNGHKAFLGIFGNENYISVSWRE